MKNGVGSKLNLKSFCETDPEENKGLLKAFLRLNMLNKNALKTPPIQLVALWSLSETETAASAESRRCLWWRCSGPDKPARSSSVSLVLLVVPCILRQYAGPGPCK